MRVTAILKGLSTSFMEEFATMSPEAKYEWCIGDSGRVSGVTVKVGTSNSFRDRVEWDSLLRGPHRMSCTVESRRGYKLAVFVALPGVAK